MGTAVAPAREVRRCPRCSYEGQGMPYFRRPGHVGLLIVASVFYAIPGIVYWLARRRHLICPRCSLPWEHSSRALTAPAAQAGEALVRQEPDVRLPSSGIKRRALGVAMVLGATLMVLMGFVTGTAEAIAVGSVIGGSGSLAFYWGWRGLLHRREAVMRSLQRKVLKLAAVKGGTLTVTEVASELNIGMSAAEDILIGMDDGFRIRSEISDEGVLYYEFPELIHSKRLHSGE